MPPIAPDQQAITEFIEAAKQQGASDEFIVTLLKQRGFSERQIYATFATYYEGVTGKPIPTRGGKIEAAKDAFLHLVAFIALGVWAFSLGSLLFGLIEYYFPDTLQRPYSQWSRYRFSDQLAGIIVAFPLYLLVMRSIFKEAVRQPERLDSGVRRWLTYIALVIAASILLGDVVTFLAYFLRGDLTVRFVLKVLVLFLIAGGIFSYYLGSLRQETVFSSRNRLFGAAAAGIVLLSLAAGFFQVGTPGDQRKIAEDRRRISDFVTIASLIHSSWSRTTPKESFALPKSIDQVPTLSSGFANRPEDPVTHQEYEYRPGSGTTYQLCATFATDNRNDTSVSLSWKHPAGHHCFSLDAKEPNTQYPSSP